LICFCFCFSHVQLDPRKPPKTRRG
jgi:hypothetical protein